MLTGTEPQLPSRRALKISLICHSATCTKRLRRPTTSSEKPRGTEPESESLKVDLHASRAKIFRELERRWAQIPVDKEYHTEPEQVEFPQAAWREKIFRDFREGIVPCTEAAPEKLWSALLVAAGLMLVPQRPARKSQAHLRKFLHAAGRRDGRRAEEHRFVDHCRTSSPRR